MRMISTARAAASILVLTAILIAGATASATDLHHDFDKILAANVSDGVVNYPGIGADPRFPAYVSKLAEALPADLSQNEQLAFYINAYNALAIKGILDGHSPASLLGRYKYFKSVEYTVGGQTMNLYDLEREVIIPFAEPRIHFAIVCASVSCPPLRAEAYSADRLNAQLDEQARTFLSDSSKNRIEPDKKTLRLSKIFDWFPKDFSDHSGSVQKYVAQYIDDKNIAAALRADTYKIKYLKYNWNLNGIAVK